MGKLLEWLHDRTGYQTGLKHLLHEPLSAGVGWWFVTGSILLFLLSVQMVTGLVLAIYYVPSPEYAYDSILFITQHVTFGRVLRSLHFFGASFIVVGSVVHMARVVLFASYKKPREVNWMVGVVLLLLILGFALTGYLLPWDQKAYWATTVTLNIAKTAPFGGVVSGILKGGTDLGALTLLRWYAAHVFLLPASLVGFTIAHLYLMRRQGISGSIKKVHGPDRPFYPYHAFKDTIAVAVVFVILLTCAIMFSAPLDALADPTDATYIPRPEWYFMSLFQLLKYFPGRLEPIGTMVIPGLILGVLFLLPLFDRRPERAPLKRPLVTGGFALIGAALATLTYMGFKSTPASADASHWGLMPIAGQVLAQDGRCAACHHDGGAANPMADTTLRKDPEWVIAHVRDPEMIAPGIRPAPRGGMSEAEARAIFGYMRKARSGLPAPTVDANVRMAADVFGRSCGLCHVIDGDGGTSAPDLTRAGAKRDAAWLREWITDPETLDAKASMPAFGPVLNDDEMTAIVNYLAARK